MNKRNGNYYGPSAYTPKSIPPQPDKVEEVNRTWEDRLGLWMRLPWGYTGDAIPHVALTLTFPGKMRKAEKRKGFSLIEDYGFRIDHEVIRCEPGALRTRVLQFIYALGKAGLMLMAPTFILTSVAMYFAVDGWETLVEAKNYLLFMLLIPALLWQISFWIFSLLPTWAIKPGRGPLWELNRRTGMVTVWDYPKRRIFQKRCPAKVIEAPFFEFDAILQTLPDRFGVTFTLCLYHRYQKCLVGFDRIISRQPNGEICFAFWDVIQNYMDVSQPLPDAPILEPHRLNDPVTAEHDRRVGRTPQYWRDMDGQTWRKLTSEMMEKVRNINTLERSDLMRQSVNFQV